MNWFSKLTSLGQKRPAQQLESEQTQRLAFDQIWQATQHAADLASSFSLALDAAGIRHQREPQHLSLANGLLIKLQAHESQQINPQKWRISVRIQVRHPSTFVNILGDYQHALGANEAAALVEAWQQWLTQDYPVLDDLTKTQPESCTLIDLSTQADSAVTQTSNLKRQVLLGPVAHLKSKETEIVEEHPFCPCCLFTASLQSLHELLQESTCYGIRFFVARDASGKISLDCRVNGEPFAAAQPLLEEYAASWPDRGLEFRKQFIVIRSWDGTATSS